MIAEHSEWTEPLHLNRPTFGKCRASLGSQLVWCPCRESCAVLKDVNILYVQPLFTVVHCRQFPRDRLSFEDARDIADTHGKVCLANWKQWPGNDMVCCRNLRKYRNTFRRRTTFQGLSFITYLNRTTPLQCCHGFKRGLCPYYSFLLNL